jgi:hypothetical protein
MRPQPVLAADDAHEKRRRHPMMTTLIGTFSFDLHCHVSGARSLF